MKSVKLKPKQIEDIELYLFKVENDVVSAGYDNIHFISCGKDPFIKNRSTYHTHIHIPSLTEQFPMLFDDTGIGFVDIESRGELYNVTKQFDLGNCDTIIQNMDIILENDENNAISTRQALQDAINTQFKIVQGLCSMYSDGRRFLCVDERHPEKYHARRVTYPNVMHKFNSEYIYDPESVSMHTYYGSVINLRPQRIRQVESMKLEHDIIRLQEYFRRLIERSAES